LASLGYSLGSTYNHVLKDFTDAGYAFGVLAVIAVVLLFVHRLRVVREERSGA
jgi:nitrate reductase gamma subunit